MENKDLFNVPYVVLESTQTRYESIIKRMIIALIVVTGLLFVSNIIWLFALSQYDYVGEDSDVILRTEGEGNANYIGKDGDITNGTDLHSEAKTPQNEVR